MIGILFWLFVGAILYTYAGYPALLALLARTRPEPGSRPPATPPVTLLITACNEETVIAEKIENSLALDYPANRLQVLVAADGSADRTAGIVRGYAGRGVELSYSPLRQGKVAAINRAMPLARGEVVIFSDANNLYAPNVVRELVRPMADPTVGAVTGAKVILQGDGALGNSEGLYWKYEAWIKEQETRLGCCTGVSGEVLAIRRDRFEPPPTDIINDDFYIAMRIARRGFRVVYAPAARSFERISLSAQDEVERRARIIAGRYQAMARAHRYLSLKRPLVAWQIASHKFLRPLVPFAMVGAVAVNLVAVIAPWRGAGPAWLHLGQPFNWVVLGLQALFYGLAWVGHLVQRRDAHGLPRALYLPTFLVNSNLAAMLGMWRFVAKRQTPLWPRAARREALQHSTRGRQPK